jgi:tetratricopeptide (TPR) repeat protein
VSNPLSVVKSIRESQHEFREGDLAAAFDAAQDAERIQPYAATPNLQEALILEANGELDAAAAAAHEATGAESTNWRTWQVLSRIEAERGDAEAALAAYQEAKRLNPRSPIFAR